MRRIALLMLLFLWMAAGVLQAQRPDAPRYALQGEFAVGTFESEVPDEDRPLPVTVWYPAINTDGMETVTYRDGLLQYSGTAFLEAEVNIENGTYPLIVFSHGSGGLRLQSLYAMEHLASYGFVVLGVNHPGNTLGDSLQAEAFAESIVSSYVLRPQDVVRTIAHAETLNAEGQIAGAINVDQIATIGHSFGGYTALAASGIPMNLGQVNASCLEAQSIGNENNLCFILDQADDIYAALGLDEPPGDVLPTIADERVRATVAWAPWNGPILDTATLNNHDVPTMIMVGSADNTTPADRDANTIYQRLRQSTPKALVTFENAGHYIYVAECNDLAIQFGLFGSCSDEVWDMARAHDLINHFTTAFLLATLYNDEDALAALDSENVDFTGITYQSVLQAVETLVPEVIAEYPHDPDAFTQGLLLHNGFFYESTGLYGESDLRRVDPETGAVLQQVDLNDQIFAEGLALIDDRLIQITWRENIAIEYDLETFEVNNVFEYEGEGWGLCFDGEALYMTDGSDNLFLRDPETFELLAIIPVTLRGQPVFNLNELECVGDDIYANVWQTDFIMRIDKDSGVVGAEIDASGLLTDPESAQADVLNGIAYDPENDIFYITGKLWPRLFEVQFVEP